VELDAARNCQSLTPFVFTLSSEFRRCELRTFNQNF